MEFGGAKEVRDQGIRWSIYINVSLPKMLHEYSSETDTRPWANAFLQ